MSIKGGGKGTMGPAPTLQVSDDEKELSEEEDEENSEASDSQVCSTLGSPFYPLSMPISRVRGYYWDTRSSMDTVCIRLGLSGLSN